MQGLLRTAGGEDTWFLALSGGDGEALGGHALHPRFSPCPYPWAWVWVALGQGCRALQHREGAPVHWHMAFVKATAGFKSGDFDANVVLVKLIPSTNSAKTKGTKGGRSKSSGWKLKLFPMYLWSTVQRHRARFGT